MRSHARRAVMVYSRDTLDNLDFQVPGSQIYRAMFEDRYGHPTDIDRVWQDREANQK